MLNPILYYYKGTSAGYMPELNYNEDNEKYNKFIELNTT